MAELLEYVGSIHIYLGPYRGNPIALYLQREDANCRIGPKAYPWNDVIGTGETPNKAAADFEEKWKQKGLAPEMFSGPSWEGGIKPERPAPPKPAAPPAGAAPAAAPAAPASKPGGAPASTPGGAPKPAAPAAATPPPSSDSPSSDDTAK